MIRNCKNAHRILRALWLYNPIGFFLLIARMVWYNEMLENITSINNPKLIAQVRKLRKDIVLFNHAFTSKNKTIA